MAEAAGTGLIFVSNEKTNNLIVLDPKTFAVVKDLKVSRRPRDMHFNADHTLLYVACGDDDVIDVIDVAKLEVVGKIATGASPESFAIDEKRRRIYVSNEEGSSLSVIDIDKGITIHEVPTGALDITLYRDDLMRHAVGPQPLVRRTERAPVTTRHVPIRAISSLRRRLPRVSSGDLSHAGSVGRNTSP